MATYARTTRRTTIEWAAGTAGTPVAATAYKTFNHSIEEIAIAVENGNTMGKYATEPPRPGGRFLQVGFSSELRGSGTNDVPPPEMALLRACAFSETASGTTPNIIYAYEHDDPHLLTDSTAGDLDPIDLVCSQDRLERTASSCVGNVRFEFIAGQLPLMHFNFRGLCATGTTGGEDAAMGTFTAGEAPVPVVNESFGMNPAEVGEVTDIIVPSFIYDCGNIVHDRPDMSGEFGFSGPIISGYAPTWRMLVEVPPTDTLNYETAYLSRSELDFQFEHDSGGGKLHHAIITASGILTEFPKTVNVNGIWYYDLVGRAAQDASSGKFKIAWQAS